MINYMKSITLFLFLIYTSISFANTDEKPMSTVFGKVVTTDNQPAIGVTVLLKNKLKTKTTLTNEEGFFEFTHIVAGSYQIEISFVGHQTINKTIFVEEGKKINISFQLKLSEKQLEEITVTSTNKKLSSTKLNIADRDMPQTTGFVSNKIITDQQAIRIGDIVKNVPGVSLTQTRFGVNESYAARGYTIGITGGAGGGSIFKNGLPVNIAGIPEAVGIEQVEIIKGSSAFLYGSSSGGLIINMVTKKPKYNFGGEVLMNIGSNQQYKPVVDMYGPLTKKLAYRFVGSYENDNSYRDVVKTKRVYINPSLLYKFGENTSLLVQGDYLNAQLTPDPGVGLLDSGRILTKAIPRSRFQNVAWAYNNVIQNSVSAAFKHTFHNQFLFNVFASYQNTDVDSYGSGNLNTASVSGIIARPLAKAHSIEKDYAVQINLDGKFNTGKMLHHFLVGADFTNITTHTDAFKITTSTGAILKTYDTINLLNPSQYIQRTDIPNAIKTAITTAPSNRVGVYFQDLISITNQLKLFVGLRYTYQATVQTTIDSMATSTRPAITINGTTPTATYNVLSPKLGLVYQPAQNTSLFISYANNFTTNTGADVYGNLLPASIINQYEAGIKNNFLNGKINTTISIYKIINSNLAQQAQYKADGVTPNTDATIKTLNGETTSDGIEVGVNATLSKNLYFITGYSYNYIRYTHTKGNKGSNIEGEQLVNAPNSTANASIFYTLSSGKLKNFKIGATGFYTGTRFGGYNNTIGQTIVGSRMIALSDFTTVDLSAGYTYKKITLQFKLSNIFNALSYLVHDNYSVTPIAPRSLTATISYKL